MSTSAYSTSGCMFSAWLLGMVHGVVVQITTQPGLPASCATGTWKACASFSGSANGKPTSIDRSVLSLYSTSASASAEPQSKHQFTGFRPRNTYPFSMILPSARSSSASLLKFMVR
ncbi:hypothetical protein D3C81_1209600 [compost metagenome]